MEIEEYRALDDFPEYDNKCPHCGEFHHMIMISEFGTGIEFYNTCNKCGKKFVKFFYNRGA